MIRVFIQMPESAVFWHEELLTLPQLLEMIDVVYPHATRVVVNNKELR